MPTLPQEQGSPLLHSEGADLRDVPQGNQVGDDQGRSLAGDLWDHARRVADAARRTGRALRYLPGQAQAVRRGPRSQAGEGPDRLGDATADRHEDERTGAPVQAVQPPPAPSVDGLADDPDGGYGVPWYPTSAVDPYSLPALIQQAHSLPYRCPACMVQGVGDACWYCGMTEGLKRHSVSYPVSGHHHSPGLTHQMLCGRTFRLDEDVDHYYDRTP